MNVSIETIHKSEYCTVAVARFHPPGGGFGNEFDAVCTLMIEGTDCRIVGLLSKGTFKLEYMLSLAKALQSLGVEKAFIRRNINEPFREFHFPNWRLQ